MVTASGSESWAYRRARALEDKERAKRTLEDDGLAPEPLRFFPGRDEGEIALTSEVVELAGELPLGALGTGSATRYETGYLKLKPLNNSRYSIAALSDGTIRLTQEPAESGDPQPLGRPLRPPVGIASFEPISSPQTSSVGVEAPGAWAVRRAKGLEERERRKRLLSSRSHIEPEPIRLIPGRAAGTILLTNEVASLAGDLPLDGVSTRYTTGYLTLKPIDNSRYRIALNEEI